MAGRYACATANTRRSFRPAERRLRWEFARAGLARGGCDQDRGGPATPSYQFTGNRHSACVLGGRWLALARLLPALTVVWPTLPRPSGRARCQPSSPGQRPSRSVKLLQAQEWCAQSSLPILGASASRTVCASGRCRSSVRVVRPGTLASVTILSRRAFTQVIENHCRVILDQLSA